MSLHELSIHILLLSKLCLLLKYLNREAWLCISLLRVNGVVRETLYMTDSQLLLQVRVCSHNGVYTTQQRPDLWNRYGWHSATQTGETE